MFRVSPKRGNANHTSSYWGERGYKELGEGSGDKVGNSRGWGGKKDWILLQSGGGLPSAFPPHSPPTRTVKRDEPTRSNLCLLSHQKIRKIRWASKVNPQKPHRFPVSCVIPVLLYQGFHFVYQVHLVHPVSKCGGLSLLPILCNTASSCIDEMGKEWGSMGLDGDVEMVKEVECWVIWELSVRKVWKLWADRCPERFKSTARPENVDKITYFRCATPAVRWAGGEHLWRIFGVL